MGLQAPVCMNEDEETVTLRSLLSDSTQSPTLSDSINDDELSSSERNPVHGICNDEKSSITERHGSLNEDSFKNIEIRLGERVTDDVIDVFCDRVQLATDMEVEGMLAMQYILLEPDSIPTLIKGDKDICQVIYDHTRAHYMVLFRSKADPSCVVVFDPIVPSIDTIRDTLNDSVRKQILAVFGHLFKDEASIRVAVETGLCTQNDSWSCGLRSVAMVTHLVFGQDPVDYEYDLEEVMKFLMETVTNGIANRDTFVSPKFAKRRLDGRSCMVMMKLSHDGELEESSNAANTIFLKAEAHSTGNELPCVSSSSSEPSYSVSKTDIDALRTEFANDTDSSYTTDGSVVSDRERAEMSEALERDDGHSLVSNGDDDLRSDIENTDDVGMKDPLKDSDNVDELKNDFVEADSTGEKKMDSEAPFVERTRGVSKNLILMLILLTDVAKTQAFGMQGVHRTSYINSSNLYRMYPDDVLINKICFSLTDARISVMEPSAINRFHIHGELISFRLQAVKESKYDIDISMNHTSADINIVKHFQQEKFLGSDKKKDMAMDKTQ